MRIISIITLLLCWGWVFAVSPVDIRTNNYLIIPAGQTSELVKVEKQISPVSNEILLETLTARNRGVSTVEKLSLIIPISEDTRFLEGSAAPLAIKNDVISPQFSIDGGLSYGFAPIMRTVTFLEDDAVVTKRLIVDASEYTHARWVIPQLEPNSQVVVALKAVVK